MTRINFYKKYAKTRERQTSTYQLRNIRRVSYRVHRVLTTARGIVFVLVVAVTNCGGNPSGPDGLTQAHVAANDAWQLTLPNGSMRSGAATIGQLFELGSGRQCVIGQVILARRPPPADGSRLTLTVGQSSQSVSDPNARITVCGSGPVGNLPTFP